MRGEAGGARDVTADETSNTTASVTPSTSKLANLNGTHGSNGEEATNGSSRAASNGAATSNGNTPTTSFYGHDREQATRLLIQGLKDMGYKDAAATLSRESGYDLESPYASAFRLAVLQGDWAEAEALLSVTPTPTDDTLPRNDCGVGSSGTAQRARGSLALSADASRSEMLFLIRQQKYLELLELRELGSALMVLRSELQPLHQDERQLHVLSRSVRVFF